MDTLSEVQAHTKGLFPGLLGIRFQEATPERVVATLTVRDDLCTIPGIMHGGAIMAFADTLGAVGTFLNLQDGAGTTTIESKTNFLGPAAAGSTLHGECVPLHRGKRTMVWQTRVTAEGKGVIAVVTQTQLVLHPKRSPQETIAELFADKSAAEQRVLLANLERGGAALYRAWAADEADPEAREALLAAAAREEENACVLERSPKSAAHT